LSKKIKVIFFIITHKIDISQGVSNKANESEVQLYLN